MNKRVSEETAKIVMKAMRWEPSERFLDALEMIMAIEKMEPGLKYETPVPTLEIFGRKISIETPRLVFGRSHQENSFSTSVERIEGLIGELIKLK